jgi:hypothetical protein
MLGWFAAGYRPSGAASVRSAGPHRESATTQHSLSQCPPSAGFKAGSVADHGVARAGGSIITLEAGDSYFEPTCETGVPTGEVQLQIKNTGRLLHNISFEDPAIDQDMAPGETVTVKVRIAKEPRPFSCKYHRGAGMLGALLPGEMRTTR